MIQMLRKLQIVAHVVWAVSAVGLGTTIGVMYGWEHHGWIGAAALGFVGFGVGAFLAASPSIILQFLNGAL